MYTLYYSPGTASLAVHWMLIELGAPFTLVEIDFSRRAQKSAEYLQINPSGHVPALVVDGVPHAECAALLMLLTERHPKANLAPAVGDPQRAEYLQWMFFLANTLQPAYRSWFYPEEVAGPENIDVSKQYARAKIEAALSRLDGLFADGRRFLVGEQMTAADFLATMLMRWSRNMPRTATQFPRLATYLNHMRTLPSLREVHVREKLADWING